MSAVRDRIEQVLCLLLARPVYRLCSVQSCTRLPIQPKIAIAIEFGLPHGGVKLRGFEQAREVVRVCILQQALVREVVTPG